MVLTVLPVGLIPDNSSEMIGDFIRISPEEEIYGKAYKKIEEFKEIGKGSCAYFKFSLQRFLDTEAKIKEINAVKLRFAFLKGSGSLKNEIDINVMPEGVWPKKNVSADFVVLAEKKIATIYPQTKGNEDSLSEIDITDYIKKCLEMGKTEVAFRLSSKNENGAIVATGKFGDSAYRPCLKVVTGVASDTDAGTLKKATLADAVYVSSEFEDVTGDKLMGKDNNLFIDRYDEAYIRFDLCDNAIFDSVYRARISLCKNDGPDNTKFKIYTINNDQWNRENISYRSRPRGSETLAGEFTVKENGRINVDVTQAVCEARSLGISSITFRIVSENTDGAVRFYGKGDKKTEPQLFIEATDDKDVVCVTEAAINALGINSSRFVTMNLPTTYTDKNEKNAKIRWSEYSEDNKVQTNRHVTDRGKVIRPKWFEGDAVVILQARIHSGDYVTKRRYRVTVPAEKAPDYSKMTFGSYLNIGDSKSEEEHKFESVECGNRRLRWIAGRIFNCRSIRQHGAMVLNMDCNRTERNYITLKLWKGDPSPCRNFRLTALHDENCSIILESPDAEKVDDNGFVYATYPLPSEFTKGRKNINLRLENYSADKKDVTESREIYGVYITQKPYFSPEEFVKQGEKIVTEPSFAEETLARFVENLKLLAISFDEDRDEGEVERNGKLAIKHNISSGNIVVAGDELNIGISVDYKANTAVIYQKTDYYDRYCAGCPVETENDVVFVDYGELKLAINKSDETKEFPYWKTEMWGVYKNISDGSFYSFSEADEKHDDSAVPEDKAVNDGKQLLVEPQKAIMLMHIADPISGAEWRVSRINHREVADFVLGEEEKVENITVKCIGEKNEDADEINVILAVYEGDRLISMCRKNEKVDDREEEYLIDLSREKMFIKKGRKLKVFITENDENLTELTPKLEVM